ncbi:hypothetical protein WN51_09385 [Melipona quadrifasciata]|uniref:Uncharacterized protein n=1 Tax=Melipona quadrifasciata TaxID=166423 RepID=A0A0M9A5M2_9HYME|nr:hypothetical protein WN51_09385 [Melipona quadrifasciata]
MELNQDPQLQYISRLGSTSSFYVISYEIERRYFNINSVRITVQMRKGVAFTNLNLKNAQYDDVGTLDCGNDPSDGKMFLPLSCDTLFKNPGGLVVVISGSRHLSWSTCLTVYKWETYKTLGTGLVIRGSGGKSMQALLRNKRPGSITLEEIGISPGQILNDESLRGNRETENVETKNENRRQIDPRLSALASGIDAERKKQQIGELDARTDRSEEQNSSSPRSKKSAEREEEEEEEEEEEGKKEEDEGERAATSRLEVFRRDIKAGISNGAKAIVNEVLVWPFSSRDPLSSFSSPLSSLSIRCVSQRNKSLCAITHQLMILTKNREDEKHNLKTTLGVVASEQFSFNAGAREPAIERASALLGRREHAYILRDVGPSIKPRALACTAEVKSQMDYKEERGTGGLGKGGPTCEKTVRWGRAGWAADFVLIILNGGRRLFKAANNEGWWPQPPSPGPYGPPPATRPPVFKKMFNAAESKTRNENFTETVLPGKNKTKISRSEKSTNEASYVLLYRCKIDIDVLLNLR